MVLVVTAGVEFIGLVTLTNAVSLIVFAVVNLALWKLHWAPPSVALTLRVPRWCPPLAAVLCVALPAAQFLVSSVAPRVGKTRLGQGASSASV